MNTKDNLAYIELAKLIYTKDLGPSLTAMLLCVSLGASNHPLGVPVIVKEFLSTFESVEEKIQWIEYTRNVIMKSTILCGIARRFISKRSKGVLRFVNMQVNECESHSLELLNIVYGETFDIPPSYVKTIGSDLYFLTIIAYGNLFYNENLVNLIETELDIIVTLIQMDTSPQLHDHINNAVRVGATDAQVKATQLIGNSVKNAF